MPMVIGTLRANFQTAVKIQIEEGMKNNACFIC